MHVYFENKQTKEKIGKKRMKKSEKGK